MTEESSDSVLSKGDIIAIANMVLELQKNHALCPVNPDELEEAVQFYRNVNAFFDTTKKTLWNTFIILTFTSILGLIGLGVMTKVKGP
jgi:hypothetical protein